MRVKYMYLMEMVITQFEQMMDYLTLTRAGPYVQYPIYLSVSVELTPSTIGIPLL